MISPQALGSDIEYPLWSNALSAKSILGGRVALTGGTGMALARKPTRIYWVEA